jgi:hypothetical protein
MKQAGATCVQEAAFTICNGITYVESCLARGMKIDDFGHVIELHFCTEMDFFEEVAKYRAVRKVWARLVRERFGGTTAKAQHFRLHAATSGRPLTAQQPLNNIARITLQALAQILGGCEQTRTASFDEALGIPTQEAARTSIRANQIIAFETGIPDTVDPLGGSYYLEKDALRAIGSETWSTTSTDRWEHLFTFTGTHTTNDLPTIIINTPFLPISTFNSNEFEIEVAEIRTIAGVLISPINYSISRIKGQTSLIYNTSSTDASQQYFEPLLPRNWVIGISTKLNL